MTGRRDIQALSDPGLRSILDDLRKRILSGRLAAGERLPAVRELAATYGVAGTTVHRCLLELGAAGFLSTHGRNGTRVVDYPPHRCCFGLVLPELPLADGTYQQRHWQAKALAARAVSTGPAQRVEIFHGINSHPELQEHVRLLAALEQHRLAGLIMVNEDAISDWLVPARLGLPVVGVKPVATQPAIGQLLLDLSSFLQGALQAVAKRGLQRVAVLLDVHFHSFVPALILSAQSLGLDLPLKRIQCVPTIHPDWASHAIAGLFSGPLKERPEALILADEIVIPAAQDALDAVGVSRLFQVHLANLPLPALTARPALRLGWNHQSYMTTAITLINAWNTTQQPIGNNKLELVEA